MLRVKEDNQATIKVVRIGFSAKLAPMARNQKVDLGSINEGIEEHNAVIDYVESAKQAATVGQWPSAKVLKPEAVAAWAAVSRAIMNLYETTSRF